MVDRSQKKDTTSTDQVLARLMQAAGVKTAAALAGLLEVTPQAISSAKKRGKVPFEWIRTIAGDTETPIDWLMTGGIPTTITREIGEGKSQAPLIACLKLLSMNRDEIAHGLNENSEEGDSTVVDNAEILLFNNLFEHLMWENKRLTEEVDGLRKENKELRSMNVEMHMLNMDMLKEYVNTKKTGRDAPVANKDAPADGGSKGLKESA